jgi:predicted permease
MSHAFWSLLRRPAYAATAVLVLACAIGAATAVFALADAVLIKPLPFADQGRLAVVWATEPESPLIEVAYPDFLDIRREARLFQDVAAHGSTPWPILLTGVGEPVTLPMGAVSGSFFEVIGTRAQLGRTLGPADDEPGAARVAVLSHPLWQQRFGGDPGVVGRVISLDQQPHVIVGVLPARFDYPKGSQLWLPLKYTIDGVARDVGENLRRIGFLYMVGRLGPGVTTAQAVDETSATIRRLFERHQLGDPARRAVVTPLVHQILGPTRPALLLLGTAAGLVLLLACINVAGLALVRASSRQTEVAVRYALGASRWNILTLLLGEAVLVCGSALVLAVPIAVLCQRAFVSLAPASTVGIQGTTVGPRALIFALAAGAVAAASVTLQPLVALAFRRTPTFDSRDWARSLKAGATAAGRGRQMLIAAEVALTVTVLTAAGLATRSFWNLRTLDLGYQTDQVLLVETAGADERRVGEALARLPGVRSVGGISLTPLTLGPIGDDVGAMAESQTIEEARRNPPMNHLRATPEYFDAMGIRILFGRGFDDRDVDGPPVVIVSDVTARALWGQNNVVGKRLRVFRLKEEALSTVVGVVASVRHREVHEARSDLYVPTRDASTWAVRSVGNPASLAGAARAVIREIDPNRPIEIKTLRTLVDAAQRPWQFTALVLASFAALALLLAATAVHGLVAYAVTLRTSEFGIRMALGAQPSDIVWLVARSTGGVALIGLVGGVPAAVAAARAMRSLLFEVSVLDATSLVGALIVLAVALAAACVTPSLRAAHVDPTITLRARL